MIDVNGRTVVVTGAASGIGRALSLELHGRGASLVLADKDTDALDPVARETGARAVTMDVGSPEDNDALASIAGSPRLLCLNAGVISTVTGAPWEASHDEWRRVLDVNLAGVVNGLRSFVPDMLRDGQPHHLLITASLAGLLTWPGGGPYAASKHALVAVAEQAALALAGTSVSVTVLCPALVRTGMSEEGAEPSDVAADALAAVGDGRFLVMPEEWVDALTRRARGLAGGRQPEVPRPAGS